MYTAQLFWTGKVSYMISTHVQCPDTGADFWQLFGLLKPNKRCSMRPLQAVLRKADSKACVEWTERDPAEERHPLMHAPSSVPWCPVVAAHGHCRECMALGLPDHCDEQRQWEGGFRKPFMEFGGLDEPVRRDEVEAAAPSMTAERVAVEIAELGERAAAAEAAEAAGEAATASSHNGVVPPRHPLASDPVYAAAMRETFLRASAHDDDLPTPDPRARWRAGRRPLLRH